MQSKRYSFALSFLTMLAIMFFSAAQAQLANVGPVTVISDKDDYAPRSNAVFTGSGFAPNETVVLKVKNLNRACNTVSADSSYLPWSVTADAGGGFTTNWLVCDCPGDSLRLKAQGQTSGYIGYAYFTDGNISFSTTGLPSGTSVTVNWSHTQGNGVTGSTVVTAPGPSTAFVVNNQQFTYAFPSSVTVNGVQYNLVSSTPASPFQIGGGSTSVNVVAAYQIACTTPSITTQPASTSTSFIYGNSATFSVTTAGTSPTYQWQVLSTAPNATWSNISNAISASYTVSSPTVAMHGYQYRVIVSGCNTSLPPSNAATLNINPKALTVSGVYANNKTYDGGTAATFNTSNAQLQGIVGADDVSLNSSSAAGTFASKNVGTDIPVTASGFSLSGSASANYSLTQPSGLKANITPATLTYTATTASRVYGDANPPFTGSVTGYVADEDQLSATTGTLVFTSPANTSSPVGQAVINGGGLTAINGNYTFVQAAGNASALTITQRPLSFSGSRTYDGTAAFAATQLTPGNLVNNDDVNISGSATVSGKNVATYTEFLTNNLIASNSNYKVVGGEVSVSITRKAASVTPAANSKTYGDNDPALTGTLSGFLQADNIGASYSRTAGETVAGSPYTISATLTPEAALLNYDITYNTANFTIGVRPITISAVSQSKIYGDPDPALTYSITLGSLAFSDAFTGSLSRAVGNNVGTYAINQGSLALNANYQLTYVGADLTITPRPITVTPNAGQHKTYGAADPAFEYTPSEDLLAGNTFVGALGRSAGEDAGLYSYNLGTLSAGDNYAVTLATTANKFEIKKRPITITVDAGQTKVYGEVDPTPFTYQITSGSLVDAAHLSGVLNRVSGENVGSYAIQQGSLAATNNYALTFVPANFSITKRGVTVTADAKSKYCGQNDPALTYQITQGSLVPGDSFSGALNRANGEDAGNSYPITQHTLTLGNNYQITYNGASLSIHGVSIDASASSNPVPSGSAATLVAQVTPGVAGVSVTFKLNGATRATVATDPSGKASLSVSGLAIDVYQVEAVVGNGCASSTAYLPVYDQNGGFVTGGGWFNSPKGALIADPEVIGKANFGFVAKYKKGSSTLEGETEFQFQAGNLKFKSTNYEAATLVISGARASYRGVGTINGSGSYKFTLVATDGQVTGGGGVDKIRMKITDMAGNPVYDNQLNAAENEQPSTILGGGSIVIHEVKSGKPAAQMARTGEVELTAAEFGMRAYPNPSAHQFTIRVESSNTADPISLRVMDNAGRVVRIVQGLTAGQTLQLGSEYKPGVYIVEMIQGNNRKQLKLLKQPN